MHRFAPCLLFVGLVALTPLASGHGALAINELETLAISDFEGHEDSFGWEGFEIWDVYVGDGYGLQNDSNGVYFKVNFAGDGTERPTGGKIWAIAFSYKVGTQTFERQISHDGKTVTTDFEELETQIADGNVFQIRAWAPVMDWAGQSLTDLVLVSSVDGQPRDTAPGGIHLPATGTEVPVEVPSTAVFPAMGEGRIVDAVPLTGPGKFLNVSVASQGNGVFEFTITNPLAKQGQHVMFQPGSGSGWNVNASAGGMSLDGGASGTILVQLNIDAAPGAAIEPLRLDLRTDIGGFQSYYAFLDGEGIALVDDVAMVHTSSLGGAGKDTPGVSFLALAVAFMVALALRSARRR